MRIHALVLLAFGAVPLQASRQSSEQPVAPEAKRAQESVEDLIRSGREFLDAGNVADAVAAFERAAELDKGSLRTHVWVVRGWIAQGNYPDALGAADDLRAAKAPAGDVDYLFGLAMFGVAKSSLATGGGSYTQSQFEDAKAALSRATALDAERYRDAWIALAECAWYALDLPTARAAAERAAALEPQSAAARMILGRVAFSQYSGASDDEQKEAAWKSAEAAFLEAVKLLGQPTDAWKRNTLADAHVQLANLHGFKERKEQAAEHYALATGWDPSKVDYATARAVLGQEPFESCMEQGEQHFLATHTDRDPLYSTLSWWLGFAHFENAKWPECETSFRRAVALWPGYANSWYYVFRACFSQQKFAEALEALRAYDAAAPEGLTQALQGQSALNQQFLEYLVGWCADPGKHNGRAMNLDAAFVSEILTRVDPTVSRFWNNLGLFLRDHGDALRWAKSPEATDEVLNDLWKRALAAYERSLELDPLNPNYLNDTAVMFHYYLKRDYEKALGMYEKAEKSAVEMLSRKDLAPDVRAVVEIAQRDSRNNIVKVKKLIEKQKRGEGFGAEDEDPR